MPKNQNLPFCPGYGDQPCPVNERVRALGRKYGVHCSKLSRAGFKAMVAANSEERAANAARWNEWIAVASREDASGPPVKVTLTQPRGKFANHMERLSIGRRDSLGYHFSMPKAQADFLVSLLRDEGIGVKVG